MTRGTSLPEFTLKAVVAGVAARASSSAPRTPTSACASAMTVSASIPAAVMTVALFRAASRRAATILEANLSQTIGSASTSLATGTIFTIPALFLWGVGAAVPAGRGAVLPRRRARARGDDPAAAAADRARRTTSCPIPKARRAPRCCARPRRARRGGAWIFRGMARRRGASSSSSRCSSSCPTSIGAALPVLPKAERRARARAGAARRSASSSAIASPAVLVAGSIVSALALTPLIAWIGAGLHDAALPRDRSGSSPRWTPGEIWSRYVRYIGAGAVATAGILTVLREPADHGRARSPRWRAGCASDAARRRRTAPSGAARPTATCRGGFVVGGIVARSSLVAALVPGRLRRRHGRSPQRARVRGRRRRLRRPLRRRRGAHRRHRRRVVAADLGDHARDAARRRPSVFAAAGWTDARRARGRAHRRHDRRRRGVEGRRHLAGSEDRLPRRRDAGAAAVRPAHRRVVRVLGGRRRRSSARAAPTTFGSQGAPRAAGDADEDDHRGRARRRAAVGARARPAPALAIAAMLCGVSGLAFAIGVYLPLASMAPIFVGGCVRALAERGPPAPASGQRDPGVLAASGLVAGEGLAGVLVAGARRRRSRAEAGDAAASPASPAARSRCDRPRRCCAPLPGRPPGARAIPARRAVAMNGVLRRSTNVPSAASAISPAPFRDQVGSRHAPRLRRAACRLGDADPRVAWTRAGS